MSALVHIQRDGGKKFQTLEAATLNLRAPNESVFISLISYHLTSLHLKRVRCDWSAIITNWFTCWRVTQRTVAATDHSALNSDEMKSHEISDMNARLQRQCTTTLTQHWPSPFTGLGAVNVGKFAETEPVQARWICVAVDGDRATAGRRFERLADLLVQLKVSYCAPVLWLCIHTPTYQCINQTVHRHTGQAFTVAGCAISNYLLDNITSALLACRQHLKKFLLSMSFIDIILD